MKRVKPRLLFQAVAFTMGASTLLLTLAKSYGALVAYVIVFSATDGMMIATYIIECLNSVEESKRASTLGFVLLFSGVGDLSSPPLSGFMADQFGNYIAAFLMAGGVGIIASSIPFLFLCLKKENEKNTDDDAENLEDPAASEDVAAEKDLPNSL